MEPVHFGSEAWKNDPSYDHRFEKNLAYCEKMRDMYRARYPEFNGALANPKDYELADSITHIGAISNNNKPSHTFTRKMGFNKVRKVKAKKERQQRLKLKNGREVAKACKEVRLAKRELRNSKQNDWDLKLLNLLKKSKW